VTSATFESQIRSGYGAKADVVLAAYPHKTDAEAATASKNIFRDTAFAWPTWTWATLQSAKGKGKAYVYYFDVRNPQSPNGASHGAEIGYVFGNLGGPGSGPAGLQGPPKADDVAISRLVQGYWVNFAKNGDPNGPGLPQWPAFTANAQNAMIFDTKASARPLPNVPQLKALDAYYAWRRDEAHKSTH
jgi:para-nitrobenzyl esterase